VRALPGSSMASAKRGTRSVPRHAYGARVASCACSVAVKGAATRASSVALRPSLRACSVNASAWG